MPDRSLDDFLSEADDTEPEDSDTPEETTTESVEPAVSTSTLHTDGEACESCGESVRRRWLEDGAYVCTECKAW